MYIQQQVKLYIWYNKGKNYLASISILHIDKLINMNNSLLCYWTKVFRIYILFAKKKLHSYKRIVMKPLRCICSQHLFLRYPDMFNKGRQIWRLFLMHGNLCLLGLFRLLVQANRCQLFENFDWWCRQWFGYLIFSILFSVYALRIGPFYKSLATFK